jgi:hypothetical protein
MLRASSRRGSSLTLGKKTMPTLSQHACFGCRKVFKKPHFYASVYAKDRDKSPPVYQCPECRADMTYMGYKFRAPRKDDTKAWKKVEDGVKSGTAWEVRTVRKKGPESKISYALGAALGIKKNRPNKAPEPTTMAVTPRAPSSTSRAGHGRGSS